MLWQEGGSETAALWNAFFNVPTLDYGRVRYPDSRGNCIARVLITLPVWQARLGWKTRFALMLTREGKQYNCACVTQSDCCRLEFLFMRRNLRLTLPTYSKKDKL